MFLSVVLLTVTGTASASARLLEVSMTTSSNQPSDVATYKAAFQFKDTTTLGAIMIEFCSDTPIEDASCDPPAGMDVSAASLLSQSGETGFTLTSPAANQLFLSRTSAARQAAGAQYEFSNITNPASESTYYVKVRTFADSAAAGSTVDFGAMAMALAKVINIESEVPPFLYFCVANTIPGPNCDSATGDLVDFGEFSSARANTATNQMLVITNAATGYNIRVVGGDMASGSNVITALATSDTSRPGTLQFGMNLRANSTPSVGTNVVSGGGQGAATPLYDIPNTFRFVSGEVVASAPRPNNSDKYTASYLVNIPRNQAAGIYVTTLTFICLANF